MSAKPLGYGRYGDDPEHVGCPRARSDMTPCVARDGHTAQADDGVCVGCGKNPADLLTDSATYGKGAGPAEFLRGIGL